MPRKSTIRQLPPQILKEVNRLLADDRHTLDQVVAHLRSMGVDDVSRSALHRHKQRFDEVAAKLRQSREVTETFVRELGASAQEGEQTRLLAEMVRSLVYDHLSGLVSGDGEADPKIIAQLARTLKELARASRLSQDYELKVREEAAREAEREAATRMEASAKKNGVSPEVIRMIRRDVLRMEE
jgi:hypothetical protein